MYMGLQHTGYFQIRILHWDALSCLYCNPDMPGLIQELLDFLVDDATSIASLMTVRHFHLIQQYWGINRTLRNLHRFYAEKSF